MSALMHRIAGPSLTLLLSAGISSPAPRPPTANHVAHAMNAVWIPGFWDLRGDPQSAPRGGWVYVPGQWVTPPAPGTRWVPGDWGWNNDWWSWTPGHWELPLKRGQSRKST